MSELILYILLICSFLLSPTGAGTLMMPGSISYLKAYNQHSMQEQPDDEADRLAAEQAAAEQLRQQEEERIKQLYNFQNYKKAELDGYGYIEVPYSHFKLVDTESTGNSKKYTFMDNISNLTISYQIRLSDQQLSNPAYEICNIKEVTSEETQNIKGCRVLQLIAPGESEGFKKMKWCVFRGASVLVLDANIADEVDTEAFTSAIHSIIETAKVYYVSNVVFDVPNTGYYATLSQGGTETKPGGLPEDGIIITNQVGSDWRDLEMVLDGSLISIPCTLDEILSLGYEINNREYVANIAEIGYDETLTLHNEDGVVIQIRAVNKSDTSIRLGGLTVKGLIVNKEDFGFYKFNAKYNPDNLPELILAKGVTWNITPKELVANFGDDYTRETLASGDYQITYVSDYAKIVIVIDSYRDIKKITMMSAQ